MSSLYKLTGQFLEFYQMAEDEDMDPDVFRDTLEGLEYEIEEKAEGYAKIIRSLEHDAAALKSEEKRMSNRRKAIENKIDALKGNLYTSMKATGKVKFKTDLFSFGIQKNPPGVVLDTDEIPEAYLIPQPPTVNKKQIMEDLKAGKDLQGVAHLEQAERLAIR